MGFSHHFLLDPNFLVTKMSGELDDDLLLKHVMDLNDEAKWMTNLKELADCRNITNLDKLTTQGTVTAASAEHDKPDSKLAILVTDSSLLYGLARAYQMQAEIHRQEVRIFNTLVEAITWLADNDHEVKVFSDFFNKI
jgi:hypothetical protein